MARGRGAGAGGGGGTARTRGGVSLSLSNGTETGAWTIARLVVGATSSSELAAQWLRISYKDFPPFYVFEIATMLFFSQSTRWAYEVI